MDIVLHCLQVLLVQVVFFLALFALRTYERNSDWTDEETLYKYVVIVCVVSILCVCE